MFFDMVRRFSTISAFSSFCDTFDFVYVFDVFSQRFRRCSILFEVVQRFSTFFDGLNVFLYVFKVVDMFRHVSKCFQKKCQFPFLNNFDVVRCCSTLVRRFSTLAAFVWLFDVFRHVSICFRQRSTCFNVVGRFRHVSTISAVVQLYLDKRKQQFNMNSRKLVEMFELSVVCPPIFCLAWLLNYLRGCAYLCTGQF